MMPINGEECSGTCPGRTHYQLTHRWCSELSLGTQVEQAISCSTETKRSAQDNHTVVPSGFCSLTHSMLAPFYVLNYP